MVLSQHYMSIFPYHTNKFCKCRTNAISNETINLLTIYTKLFSNINANLLTYFKILMEFARY